MKYVVIVGDGMADYPLEKLGGKTPLQYAATPHFDRLAAEGTLGLVRTIPPGLPPGSDTANLSVFGYDPLQYYTGRSPFEAASMGIDLSAEDISFRCNLVTLSADEPYPEKTMVDYCSGEISTTEAHELIITVQEKLGGEPINFHTGFRYRHLMVWRGGPGHWKLTPPHDISGKKIGPYLPEGPGGQRVLRMMEESYTILGDHPVNTMRLEKGLNPANSIWIWGNGSRPKVPGFPEKYGLKGSVISAVDLVKGIGVIAGLDVIEVEGATGDIDTNYDGKVKAALEALRGGRDFVYLHIEAPDECSHRFETENKVKAIELIDDLVVRVVMEELKKTEPEYSIMLLTDHATPLSLGTHTADPVPFTIYRSGAPREHPGRAFDEANAEKAGLSVDEGYRLMDRFLGARG